jgi:NAD(P)-dependent dehydrogenase (short-subunit alcohol dehydrogenase family)
MPHRTQEIAVITGGARGIGFGIAAAFAAASYRVVLMDRDETAAADAANRLRASHGADKAMAATVDLTNRGQVEAAITSITQTFGKIGVLVNNAGIVRDRRLVKMEESDWDDVIATNLKSQFLTCRAVVPGMIERGYGRIINISSRAWLGGFGQSNYSAAKGGVVSLTRSLAIELAGNGITVNAIAPGIVDTPMFQGFDPAVQDRLKKSVPMKRIGTPEDVAAAAVFFASRGASYITGQLIYVCGGRSLSSPSV